MNTFKSFSEASTKDITKYSSKDLGVAFSKFLFTNEDDGKATYMTITGPDKSGEYLYPKGSYYVGHWRVNPKGGVEMGNTGTARLVTYDLKDAKAYIKKYGNVGFQKKQIEKGRKGMGNWPTTYDLTGDFKGQGRGSDITKIDSLDQIRY